jgi:hypothetical protein
MSTTSEQCWVPVFVDWVEGETDTLDFDGREVPERLQRLLTALEPPYHVLTLTAGGWNLQHPLECRPNLGDCRWNAEAAALEQALRGRQAEGRPPALRHQEARHPGPVAGSWR